MLLKQIINSEMRISYKVLFRGEVLIFSFMCQCVMIGKIHYNFHAFSALSSWDIVTGVCVERLPVVTPPLNEIQKKFKDLLWTMEIEKSLKSDHEIRHENDKLVDIIYLCGFFNYLDLYIKCTEHLVI